MDSEGEGLLMAFNALVATVEPERRVGVLKRAIGALIGSAPGYRVVGGRKDADAWAVVRAQLRAAMHKHGLTGADGGDRAGSLRECR